MQPMDANTGVGAGEALPETLGVVPRCVEDTCEVDASLSRAIKVLSWSKATELVTLLQVYLAWKFYLSMDDLSVDSVNDSALLYLISLIIQSVCATVWFAIVRRNFRRTLLTLSTLATTANVDTDLELEKSSESTSPADSESDSSADGEGVQRIVEKNVKQLSVMLFYVCIEVMNKIHWALKCKYSPSVIRDYGFWLIVAFFLQYAVALVQLWLCRRQLKTFLGSFQRRLEA